MGHKITIGDEEFPAKWAICWQCRGEGKIVNPSIDGHGLSSDDFREDPDFAEDYFGGKYDIRCPDCKGAGKKLEPNEDVMTDQKRESLYAWMDAERDARSMEEAERRAGC